MNIYNVRTKITFFNEILSINEYSGLKKKSEIKSLFLQEETDY